MYLTEKGRPLDAGLPIKNTFGGSFTIHILGSKSKHFQTLED